MRNRICITIFLLIFCGTACCDAQNAGHFKKIVKELSSSKYQGRGYAEDGVRKAARYIAREFEKSGVDEVILQSFTLDINTFPGRMKMSVDGRRLSPGDDFVMREYSPGASCSGKLYYLDTLNYDAAKIFADLSSPVNDGCFVVCDFWFTYKHSKDFRKMESDCELLNAGVIYTWNTPLKFYKAYGEKVSDKPIIWVSKDFPRDASCVKVDVENEFLSGYRTENVIAKVEGERHDSCFVFTAHYDHLGNLGRHLWFPGANDNASGTAGIITLAEYYSNNRSDFDMYFIAFSGEDANLRGSTYFTEHPLMDLSSVKYLFNLDMIGDNNPIQYCEVSVPGENGFERMCSINESKGYFKELHRGELAANSDHWPFAQLGVPCILFENENGEAFKYYHTAMDDINTVRFETFVPITGLIIDFIGK